MMKAYQITSNLSIEGDTLKDAIEECFPHIARHLNLGNAAGYQLHEVWCEYEDRVQAVVLHITACGSDALVNYDPTTDVPKNYSLIIRAEREDCPKRINFDLSGEQSVFDPFDDSCLTTPSAYFGTLLGIIDEIALHHCKIGTPDKVTTLVTCQLPTASTTIPLKYVELCRARLTRLKPKTDNGTTRMMERVSELALKIMDYPKEKFAHSSLFQAKTATYFETNGKITALAAIRTAKGMTQKQLADAAQMSVRQLQNYEKCPGSTLFSASNYVPGRLADALGVDRSEIVDANGFAVLVNK